jgi:hypothetical protein
LRYESKEEGEKKIWDVARFTCDDEGVSIFWVWFISETFLRMKSWKVAVLEVEMEGPLIEAIAGSAVPEIGTAGSDAIGEGTESSIRRQS